MSVMVASKSSRRVAGIVSVLLVHAVVIAGLVSGLGRRPVMEVMQHPLEVRIFDEIKPPPPPPAPPPKAPAPPRVAPAPAPRAAIPKPQVEVPSPPPAPAAITAVTTAPPPAVPAPVEGVAEKRAEPVRVAPVIDAAHSCRLPQYPAASRRAGEVGVVVLRFLVAEDGTAVDSQVETSSGHDRLDEAARAALSLCRFKPGSVDGRPERAWARIRYVWKLN